MIDTNVLVSGLYNPYGPPGVILKLMEQGAFQACVSEAILSEYDEVLKRPAHGLDPAKIDALLLVFAELAMNAQGSTPPTHILPDPDDQAFLDAALAGHADAIVTGNKKHFPDKLCEPVKVMSPREFVDVHPQAQSDT